MNSNRTKPGSAISLTVTVLLPPVYVASILGLAWSGLGERFGEDSALATAINIYAAPWVVVYQHAPEPVRHAMNAYLGLIGNSI